MPWPAAPHVSTRRRGPPARGAGTSVFNLKFIDKASGELLLALHHEVESSSTWSSTDSKLGNWVNRFAKRAAKRGSFAKLYQSGDEADD